MKIEVDIKLLNDILSQLKGAQQDQFVESTEHTINELETTLKQPREYRVIIAGSRTFKDYPFLEDTLNKILTSKIPNIQIVSGGQISMDENKNPHGADYLGEQWARKKAYPIHIFPANWNKHGKAGGPIRNKQMAEYADALIAFHDGQSKGTANMIEEARKAKIPVRIIPL